MTVAETIYKQLGGARFAAMTGAKQFSSDANSLRFIIGRNKTNANRVKIVLRNDLYDLVFEHVSTKLDKVNFTTEIRIVEKARLEGIDVENLCSAFTSLSGLYTSLR